MANLTIPVLENIGKQLARNTARWHHGGGKQTKPKNEVSSHISDSSQDGACLRNWVFYVQSMTVLTVDLHISSSSAIR